MNAVEQVTVEQISEQRDALVGRLFEAFLGTIDLQAIYLGDRLGFYQALADTGPATPTELADRTGTAERYAQEWLEQQAVTGILAVENADIVGRARRYRLPAGHAEVLLDQESLNYAVPLAKAIVAFSQAMTPLLAAYRTGRGVPYSAYGEDAREAQAAFNRPAFLHFLGTTWLPALPDLHARLQADPPARVADIGCGAGWSSIAIARAYPKVRVDGFDNDEPSIAMAWANAKAAGLSDRVSFHVRDAAEPTLEGRYDLVAAFEVVHDVARPVDMLRTMRRLAGAGGAVIVMEERVGEIFTAPGDDLERLFYGSSILFCLPTGMAETPSAATGTVMRPETLRRYASEAGFRAVEILPIEHDFFWFYRLII
jgi:2-polyprenyl-3-methyl-5-hydroxy-6-metoxy-1,4-benzoquinol methylase